MVSLCLPSDVLSQHLPSYLAFSYLGRGLSLHRCSNKAQPLLPPAAMDRTKVGPKGATPRPRSGVVTKSARLQWHRSGLEELPGTQGQGQQQKGATPRPRSGSRQELPHVQGASGGPRGSIPCSRLGGLAMRRYPSSKVRSSGCPLLEQM